MRLALVGLDKDLLDILGDRVVAIFDPNISGDVWGIPVIGGDQAWAAYSAAYPDVRPLLAIDPPQLRRKLAAHYGAHGLAAFIAPTARVSTRAGIGNGTIVQQDAFISADVRLGDCARINVGAAIHHDCNIGSFVTIAPRAALMGSVAIGDDAYIGAGAVILQGIAIGKGAVVGAGAVVTAPVEEGQTVIGVPAKAIATRKQ